MADHHLVQITESTDRRDVLRTLGAAAVLGALTPSLAQHVHQMAASDKKSASGPYQPKAYNAHEYATIQRLADLIVPEEGAQGGALAAGAPEFIDLLSSQNSELKEIYTSGIRWLDSAMQKRGSQAFVSASPTQQTALLDLLAYRRNRTPELAPGMRFFEWARKMAVDAYFTSAVGIKDLGYMGNTAVAEFTVPQNVVDYVLKRSPV